MMLLFLALMMVYVIWYQIQWDELKQPQEESTWSGIQILSKSGEVVPTMSPFEASDDESEENLSWVTDMFATTESVPTTWTSVPTKTTTGTTNKNPNINMLSGTSIYYGQIALIEKLGIKYQYALTDEKGIWYMYLGTPSYDFASITRALKGSLYSLTTEQAILQNKLFGNKVVFINLPEYKDKQVCMLIYLNDGIWLIQMEYSLYHKSKTYLKSLFID